MSENAALLQLDVVDSTRLTELLGSVAVSRLWAEHDALARDLLKEWNGKELERSDGFLLCFETVRSAVGYALAYHGGLATLSVPLQARAGIHHGPLEFRQNSDAHVALGARAFEAAGLSIPLTVRIMSLALGHQTLMSDAAKRMLGTTDHRVVSHGFWRLKGIAEPQEIHEIAAEGSSFTPPSDAAKAYCVVRIHQQWLPRREVPNTLPAERNSFVGREAFLRYLADYIDAGARLISVLGTAGAGKTRLVQRFGWDHLGTFAGGVWYCDLSQATTFDGLCGAVAQGLGIPLGQSDPVEQIGHAIAGRGDCLIVLDNFEQIVAFAGNSLGRWLDHARQAKFIVTTRSVLGLDGEEIMTLPPLDRIESSALFVQRARAARRDFKIESTDSAHIGNLIDLLDGLPLAIELAAARVRVMSLPMMVERMRERFKLLATTSGRPSRRATLQAALDWSWEPLPETERLALAQLSIFEGGFTLGAAEAVLTLKEESAPSALDIIHSLVDKSWLQRTSNSRFSMFKSIQAYAAVKLRALDVGDTVGVLRRTERNHWRYFGSLSDIEVTAERCIEVDNVVLAVRNAVAQGEADEGATTLVKCWHALKLRGPYGGVIELAEQVRNLPNIERRSRVLVEYVAGSALHHSGEVVQARRCFEAGLALISEEPMPIEEARLLAALGEHTAAQGMHLDAKQYLERAWRIVAQVGDTSLQCFVLNALGNLAQKTRDFGAARTNYDRALKVSRSARDRLWEGGLLGNLGGVLHGRGDLEMAKSHYEQALAIAEETGDRRWEGNTRCNLGLLLHEMGLSSEGLRQLEMALSNARSVGRPRLELTVLWNAGLVEEAKGEIETALVSFRLASDIASRLDDENAVRELTLKIEQLQSVEARLSTIEEPS